MKTLSFDTTLELVNAAYVRLEVLDNIRFTKYRENMLALCYASQDKDYIGLAAARKRARAQVVKSIASYVWGKPEPRIADYLTFEPYIFLAASLVANYRTEIVAALEGFDVGQLAALDVCAFH